MEEHYDKFCAVEAHVQALRESKKTCTVIDLVYDSQGPWSAWPLIQANYTSLDPVAVKENRRRSLRRKSTQEFSEEDAKTIFEYPMGDEAKVGISLILR